MAKRKASVPIHAAPADTAALFDATAYERELAALRERHTTSLRAAIEEAAKKRDQAEAALAALELTLGKV